MMQKINKTLEDTLIKEGKPVEAVTLVQQELVLGLKKSKEIVDHYR